MKFTYESYNNLITLIREKGYAFTDYHNYTQHERAVILRHDVDMSLGAALKMARLEHALGVKATYFILMKSDFYNPFTVKSMEAINGIRDLGHEIGLHFDEAQYKEGENVPGAILREATAMETELASRIRTVSMHRPSGRTLDSDYVIDGGRIINSYSKEFFCRFEYITDSRMMWHKDIEAIVREGRHRRLHVLSHPIWYGEREADMSERLKGFCLSAAAERYESLNGNIRSLQEVLGKAEIGAAAGTGTIY